MADDDDSAPKPATRPAEQGDRALVLGPVAEDAIAILRQRTPSSEIEAGIVRPLREGKPIVGEVVKLTSREGSPRLCDVEVQLAAPTAKGAPRDDVAGSDPRGAGPAKVNSTAFRERWEAIFATPRGLPS